MNFIDAVGDWKSNDEWQYADKEAAWKFFFAAGKESSQAVISAQCVKMSQYESIIFELRRQLAKAEQRVAEWQPISTAPKETEIFIGRFIDGKFMFGKSVLFYEQGNEFEGEFYRGWYWSIDDVYESVAECPTHWMPLPKPPAIDAAMLPQGEQK